MERIQEYGGRADVPDREPGCIRLIKNLSGGKESAYSKFMANATFLIQSPRTLVKVVEGIDALDMNNRDTMGDVYEYVLGKMAASGNNGQFRTPRHIIRMMVELMDPQLKDTICDPAMGSAGFIVESAKYIQSHYKKELLKRENADHYKSGMLHGFDTDATMLRIGAMNLMLHGSIILTSPTGTASPPTTRTKTAIPCAWPILPSRGAWTTRR